MLTWLSLAGCAEPPGLVLVAARHGHREVWWSDGQHSTRLERFPSPEVVVGTQVSSDGRWAYVWHRPDHQAQRVSVYDVAARERISTFTPGYGGELRFDTAGDLVHTWGCGTSCANLRVYDRAGRIRTERFAARIDVSPDGDHAVYAPDVLGPSDTVVWQDLTCGEIVNEASPWRLWEWSPREVTWGADQIELALEGDGVGSLLLDRGGGVGWRGDEPGSRGPTVAVPGAAAAVLQPVAADGTRLEVDRTDGFAAGASVLIVRMGPRSITRARLASVEPGALLLEQCLEERIEPPGVQVVQIVEAQELVVPGKWEVPRWDGLVGGVAAFSAGRLTVAAEIDADDVGPPGPAGASGGLVFIDAQEIVGGGSIHARGTGDGGTLWLDAPIVDVRLDATGGVDAAPGQLLRVPRR